MENPPSREPPPRDITLHVTGMGSRRCVREVTAALCDVDGVESLLVQLDASTVRVHGTMALESLLGALDPTRYTARPVSES